MKNTIFDLSKILISKAIKDDIAHLYLLQKRGFVQEAEIDGNYSIIPIIQTLESYKAEFESFTVLKATVNDIITGSVRGCQKGNTCYIGRLVVEPVFQEYGIGGRLINAIESHFPDTERFELFTAEQSVNNVRFYKNHGYTVYDKFTDESGVVLLKFEKRRF